MATAYPTQLYEIVSEEEALSRNARQYPRFGLTGWGGGPQQPVIMPAPVMPGNPPIMAPAPGQQCEQKCRCDWHCPRM